MPTLDRQPTLVGRLVALRPLGTDDFESLFAAAADPLIWAQHPDSTRWRRDEFRAYFEAHLRSGGALVVIDRATGDVIGASRYDNLESNDEVEIGWTFLARPYWGGRYNADLKRLMLTHAFHFVKTVVFLVSPENHRSRKAVQKLGAIESGTRRGQVLYRLTREAYAATLAKNRSAGAGFSGQPPLTEPRRHVSARTP